MFYYLILDASHTNACATATCDCYSHSHHLIADGAGTFAIVGAADAFAFTNDLDANDLTINVADIDGSPALNTPSPIILRNKKETCTLLDDSSTTTTTTTTTATARKQTRSKLAQHRKSLSESDLLNEIDNALVFCKGFLYSHGKRT